MKKLTFLAAATLLTAQAAQPTYSGGYYVGAYAASANTHLRIDYKFNEMTIGSHDAQYGVFGGYDVVHQDRFVSGLELFAGIDKSEVTAQDDENSMRLKRKLHYGFSPRLGILLTPQVLAYVRLGVEGGQWKIKSHGQKLGHFRDKISNVLLSPGVGVDVALTRNIFARMQYHFLLKKDIYSDFTGTIEPSQKVLTLAVGYKF